jgi:hypothetical protein
VLESERRRIVRWFLREKKPRERASRGRRTVIVATTFRRLVEK